MALTKQRHRPWVNQPVGAVGLRRGHWSTDGLVSAIVPTVGGLHQAHIDIASNVQLAWNVSSAQNGTQIPGFGTGKSFLIADSGYLTALTVPLTNPLVTGWTAYLWTMPNSATPGTARTYWSVGNSGGTTALIRMQQTVTTGLVNIFQRNDASTSANFSHTTQLQPNTPYAVVGWSSGTGGSHGIRVRGPASDVIVTNSTAFASSTITLNAYGVGVDYRSTFTQPGDQWQIGPFIYNRVHEYGIQNEIMRNPWIIFEPQHRILTRPVVVSTGSKTNRLALLGVG